MEGIENIGENKFVPEQLLRQFEAARIEPEKGFADVYVIIREI